MAAVLRSWNIRGDDGKIYTVQERERPGIRFNGRTVPSGVVEYFLADGADVTDDTPGHWETMAGVLLKKPDDL
jgi:hypothetical protein